MERLNVSPDIKIEIVLTDVSGDLRVRAWEREEIGAEGDRVTLQQQDQTQVIVRCDGDCRLNVPARAALTIKNVAGDARITGVMGELTLDNVAGDLILRDVGPTRLTNVSADLRVKRVEGGLHVTNIGADATVLEVKGDIHMQRVGADMFVRNVDGSCIVDRVGSDLVLSTQFDAGKDYHFHAGSDVVCRVLPGTNARFIIPGHVELRVEADDATQGQDDTHHVVVFGDGEAEVHIEAGAEVRLVSQPEEETGFTVSADLDFDLGTVGISVDLEEKLAELEQTLSEKLSGLDERIRANVERQAAKVEKQAERLRRQAEKQAERIQRAAERRARKTYTWGTPPTPPRPPEPPAPPPADPVSDEERLMILRMVESRQITVEEAERLLAALEGRAK